MLYLLDRRIEDVLWAFAHEGLHMDLQGWLKLDFAFLFNNSKDIARFPKWMRLPPKNYEKFIGRAKWAFRLYFNLLLFLNFIHSTWIQSMPHYRTCGRITKDRLMKNSFDGSYSYFIVELGSLLLFFLPYSLQNNNTQNLVPPFRKLILIGDERFLFATGPLFLSLRGLVSADSLELNANIIFVLLSQSTHCYSPSLLGRMTFYFEFVSLN